MAHILQTLVCYRLIDPGSEWRLHRMWFEQSAMGDLLGADYGLVEIHALYCCLDKLLEHKTALYVEDGILVCPCPGDVDLKANHGTTIIARRALSPSTPRAKRRAPSGFGG